MEYRDQLVPEPDKPLVAVTENDIDSRSVGYDTAIEDLVELLREREAITGEPELDLEELDDHLSDLKGSIEEWKHEAEAFAREHCEICKSVPEYEPEYRWSVTPEEYAAGMKECYTENSHRAYCRHRCTNYDALLAGLDRGGLRDRILYDAIRARIEELLDDV